MGLKHIILRQEADGRPAPTRVKQIGDSFSIGQNPNIRIAGQLREEAGPYTDHIVLIFRSWETSWTTYVQKGPLGGQRGVMSTDVPPRCLFSRIHLG